MPADFTKKIPIQNKSFRSAFGVPFEGVFSQYQITNNRQKGLSVDYICAKNHAQFVIEITQISAEYFS